MKKDKSVMLPWVILFEEENSKDFYGYSVKIIGRGIKMLPDPDSPHNVFKDNRMVWHCGYITVPEGHPCAGLFYDDVDVKIHGGLTYSSERTFGFDTNHGWEKPEHQTLEYLKKQCRKLAKQLKEMEGEDES